MIVTKIHTTVTNIFSKKDQFYMLQMRKPIDSFVVNEITEKQKITKVHK